MMALMMMADDDDDDAADDGDDDNDDHDHDDDDDDDDDDPRWWLCNKTCSLYLFVLGEIYFIQQDRPSYSVLLYDISSLFGLPGKPCRI